MAVERAALEAAKSGRELVVVHTWLPAQPFTFVGRNREPEFPSVKRLHQKSLDSAIARARRVAPRIRLTPILLFGPTLRGLAVAARDASLLVVGTHRHGIIADAVLGGTGEKILATATFPVMIVNSDLISRDAPRGIVSRTTV
jgi:nucleotide-binding universal stress UspA family protein